MDNQVSQAGVARRNRETTARVGTTDMREPGCVHCERAYCAGPCASAGVDAAEGVGERVDAADQGEKQPEDAARVW